MSISREKGPLPFRAFFPGGGRRRRVLLRGIVLFLFFLGVSALPAAFAEDQEVRRYFESGMDKLDQDDIEGAIEDFNKALELSPRLPQIHNALGVAYLQGKAFSFEEAVNYFEEAIRLQPHYAEAYYNLGAAYSGFGRDLASGKKYFEESVKQDPRFAKGYQGLGWVSLTEEKDADKAAEFFRQAVDLDQDFSDAWFGLGISFVLKGQKSRAIGPITKLRALKREQLAMSLEEMMRDESLIFNKPGEETAQAPPLQGSQTQAAEGEKADTPGFEAVPPEEQKT